MRSKCVGGGGKYDMTFGVVRSGWYWAGGRGGGVFMMFFHRMACVFLRIRATRIHDFHGAA